MKIKEVLTLAAFYLQLEDVLALPHLKESYLGDDIGAGGAEKTLSQLIRCAFLAAGQIAAEYYPLIAVETVTTDNGAIKPESLKNRLIEVRRITQNKQPVKFKEYPSAIRTVGGKVEIEYSYLPGEMTLNGETGFGDKIGARIIAYGTAAEYCLVTGLFEEASIWEKRFKDSLQSVQRKKSEVLIKPRIWS